MCKYPGSSRHGTVETNLTRNHKVVGLILGLAYWVKDPALLWLWCRLATPAPMWRLAWELPYAMRVDIKKKNKKQNKTH